MDAILRVCCGATVAVIKYHDCFLLSPLLAYISWGPMRALHNGIPLSIYAYKTRKQELHQGFFLSLFLLQLTLTKGDKGVD